MSGTVFLHVGLPKSGTTYLQAVLDHHKDLLAREHGLLYPGDSWNDQVRAVRDLRELGPSPRVDGAWARLVDEVRGWSGDAVVSMEWLVAATRRHVRRAVEDLAPAQVEVVFTARDLARALPSAWQEAVKNGKRMGWAEYLAGVSPHAEETTAHGKRFWRRQDLPAAVQRWSSVVGPEHVHVVTLPGPGGPRDALWSRFAGVLGLDAQAVSGQVTTRNESLGWESTELLRRVNGLLRGEDPERGTKRFVKQELAKGMLAPRRPEESSPVVPPEHRAWVEQAAREHIASLESSGVRVVGDLQDLAPVWGERPARLDPPTDSAVLDAAVAAVVALSQRLVDQAAESSSDEDAEADDDD